MPNTHASPAIAALATLVANAQRQLGAGPYAPYGRCQKHDDDDTPLNADGSCPRCAAARVMRGSIVRVLSDGTIGEVTHSTPDAIRLVHGDRNLGRGPWVLVPSQVEVVDETERLAYLERCVDARRFARAS